MAVGRKGKVMKSSSRRPLSHEVMGALDLSGRFFNALAVSVMSRGGGLEDLRRAVDDRQLLEKITDLIVPKVFSEEVLPPFFKLPVDYQASLNFRDLQKDFTPGGVSRVFADSHEWHEHASCRLMDCTSGDRVMRLWHLDRKVSSEKAIRELTRLHEPYAYRPATPWELYAFSRVYPDLQRQFWIVALGAHFMWRGQPCVAVLQGDENQRMFEHYLLDHPWSKKCRFLSVCTARLSAGDDMRDCSAL